MYNRHYSWHCSETIRNPNRARALPYSFAKRICFYMRITSLKLSSQQYFPIRMPTKAITQTSDALLGMITGMGQTTLQTQTNEMAVITRTVNPKKLKKLQQIQKLCIDMAIDVVKAGEGGLFVIGDTKHYSTLFPNFFENQKASVFDKGMNKVLVKLGQIDGAVVIDSSGFIKAYGAHLARQSPLPGHGTRHAAAKGISMQPGITAVLASQEGKVIRIFKNGVQLIEINPYTKGVDTQMDKIVNFINRPEAALVTGAAVGSSVLGVALLPGIVVFAGSYYIANKIFKLAKDAKTN